MSAEEMWCEVPGWEGFYSVSDQGRVRSESRQIVRANGWPYTIKPKILKPGLDSSGYLSVGLCRADRGTSHRVNVLVLEAFVGPRPPGAEACHRNGLKTDNVSTNLYWGDKRLNAFDTVKHGANHLAAKTRCKYGHQFTEANTYRFGPDKRWRDCRTCMRDRAARRRRR